VHLWHGIGRAHCGDVLSLREEDKLRFNVAVLETLRQADPQTPRIVSFGQPWGEYLGRQAMELSPIHVADALVRADVGLSGIGLEINFGYYPGGTPSRDLLEISGQIDRWSQLELPLLIFLTAASSAEQDAHAAAPGRPTGNLSGPPNLESQRSFVERLVPLLLAKPSVHGIVWNQFRDDVGHEFPHGGLLDTARRPKPAFDALRTIRRQHLTA
jgi:hypothetical protein